MMTTTSEPARTGCRTMFGADFDSLRVGERYESERRAISAGDVAVFAALTGDHHPAHVDAEWAAGGPFGRPIAHGLLILSCATGTLPLDPDRVIALRGIRDLVFKRPLGVGDEIEVRAEVTGLRPVDGATGLVECGWRIVDADGRLLARAVVEILWRRGGAVLRSEQVDARLEADHTGDGELDAVQVDGDGVRVLI